MARHHHHPHPHRHHPHAHRHHPHAHKHHAPHPAHHAHAHHKHHTHIDPAVKKWLLGGGIAEAMAHRIEHGGGNGNPFGLSPLTLVLGGATIAALVLRR